MSLASMRATLAAIVLFFASVSTGWCDILGVAPGYPNTTFATVTGTSYNPATGLLTVTSVPQATLFASGGVPVRIGIPRALSISIKVDSAGRLAGGIAGDDLVLTGTAGSYSGTLLTGEIVEFGIRDASATIDYLDFRFRVTGGSMAGLFAGQDLGVSQSIEASSFNGSFGVAFSGGAKGNLGPIAPRQVCSGSIGDFVWNDLNRNGIQDAGEPGIDNVRVALSTSGGTTLGSVLSGPNGAYLFSGLCAGSYRVTVDTATLPAGFVPSAPLQGDDLTRDSNQNGASVLLSGDDASDRTVDFGYNSPCTGSIGDLVWHDQNRNGIQDPGEPGINGVTLNLRTPGDNSIITSTTTDGSGNYRFNGLCAGTYRVEVVAPNGFVSSPALLGSNPTLDSNPSPFEVTLPGDFASDQGIDFGFNTPCTGSIGDLVWNDLNRDGIQDAGEPGINGVGVILKDSFSNQTASAITTGNGYYQFAGLCAGTYRVELDAGTLPAGMVASPSGAGSDRSVDSKGSPYPVVLTSDASSDATVDFGYNTPCSGSIGDMVWIDANRDGIQNAGEIGINGVPVVLKDASNTVIASTKTGLGPLGQAGFYSFKGICAGNYSVEVATPAGLQPSPSLQGSDTTVDSNGSPASVYLPADGSVDATIDFGFNPPCSGTVGNLVWDDQNRDGIQDPDETGLDGVTVNLRNQQNQVIASTTTAGGGLYQFGGLCAGDYLVEAIPSAGRVASPVQAGTDRTADSNPNPASVTVTSDTASDQSIDFGFNTPCTGTIGNLVWHDTNRDGIQDPLEPGMKGAAVALKNSQGVVIATTNTGDDGGYLFGGVCAGSYTVEVTTPAGFVLSPVLVGDDGNLDSNPIPAPVTLVTDASSDLSIDFGFNTPCSGAIGDLVWNDLNADGIQDSGEPGIGGATVLLRDDQNTLLRTTTTLGDGSYQFIGLCAGSYRVEVAPPAGTFLTRAGAGSDTSLDSNADPASVTLAGDTDTDNSIDFGFVTAALALALTESCSDAAEPGLPIAVSASITNTGNETLTGFTCTDSAGQLAGVPDSLAPGATATMTLSYLPTGSNSTDTIFCSASGVISGAAVSADSRSTCNIISKPALSLTESCQDAPAPGQPITFWATLTNSGNETLTGITCTDSKGALTGVPATLAKGATATLTGSYLPTASGSTDSISCSATGAINGTAVSAGSSATCGIITNPSLSVTESCTDASSPTQPITFTATISNTGNETLTGISCTDSLGTTQLIANIAPGASNSVTFSYVQSISPLSDSVTCSAKGAISNTSVFGSSAAKSCTITTPPVNLARGDAATIGFWHNKNGQALILSLNGGSNKQNLATWLATNFPYLYGANAGPNNLSGKTNVEVAALFMKFFRVTGAKVDAQVMAGALAVYVTNSSLAGTLAIPYGFNVSSSGTGAKTYAVGSYGTALGLSNNVQYSIMALLLQANAQKKNGTFNANAFNAVFDGINTKGDIV